MMTNIHFLSNPAHFLEWETFQRKFGENLITPFTSKPFFFLENLAVYE
jgi:hypothetical protein